MDNYIPHKALWQLNESHGARLNPLGTTGLLYQPQMIDNDDDCGATGGMRIGRGNRSTRRKPAPVPLCPPQISHDLIRARTRAAAVGSHRLTAWAMARPWQLNESHGVRLSPLGTAATVWPIVQAPNDRWWWLWSNWWNENRQGKPKYWDKTCPSAPLSTTNPTWPDPGWNPGRGGEKPATNPVSYGTALAIKWVYLHM
jgi:hypothetical protein